MKPGEIVLMDPKAFPVMLREPGPQQFSLLTTGAGVVVCEKYDGAKLILKCGEDVENLRKLLATIDVTRLPPTESSYLHTGDK